MFLDQPELAALTNRLRKDAQAKMLRYMGIEHRVRADGSIAVLRAHVQQAFGMSSPPDQQAHNLEPDWSAM